MLAQEIVVPRVDSLGTTLSQDQATDRVEGVEDREATLEQFGEITGDLGVYSHSEKDQ